MAVINVTFFRQMQTDQLGRPMPILNLATVLSSSDVDFTAGVQTIAVPDTATAVRCVTDTECRIAFADASAAIGAGSTVLVAKIPDVFGVEGGGEMAVEAR
jgi:hypothetical protein